MEDNTHQCNNMGIGSPPANDTDEEKSQTCKQIKQPVVWTLKYSCRNM